MEYTKGIPMKKVKLFLISFAVILLCLLGYTTIVVPINLIKTVPIVEIKLSPGQKNRLNIYIQVLKRKSISAIILDNGEAAFLIKSLVNKYSPIKISKMSIIIKDKVILFNSLVKVDSLKRNLGIKLPKKIKKLEEVSISGSLKILDKKIVKIMTLKIGTQRIPSAIANNYLKKINSKKLSKISFSKNQIRIR